MLRLCLLQFLSILLISTVTESARIERDACDEIRKEFDACSRQAYTDYQMAFQKGDDGRPDWMARKSCNYMTAAVEDCGNQLIGECNTAEEVTTMKDHQLKGILAQLQTTVAQWDSSKCPAIKAHIDRINGVEVEEVAPPPESGKQEKPQPEATTTAATEEEATDSGASITASIVLVAAVVIAQYSA